VREYDGEVLLCVAHLSRSAQAAEIDLSPWRGRSPQETIGHSEFPPIRDQPYLITLAPYGLLWLRLCEPAEPRAALPTLVPEFETLVLARGKSQLAQQRTRTIFERDVLPAYLGRSRWFADKGSAHITARLKAHIPLGDPGGVLEIALVEAKGRRETAEYVLPLGVRWTRFERERENPRALAAARQGAREGTLLDVAADEDFISLLLDKVRKSEDIAMDGRRLEFRPGRKLAPEPLEPDTRVRAVDTEQSNTTALVGSEYVVKLFRRAEPGVNPEIEIGRFLTDVVEFRHSPPLLGTVELVEEDRHSALAVVHGFVENQGEAWTVTSAYLDRFVEEQRLLASDDAAQSSELTAYQRVMELIAMRLGEMQIALASRDDIPDFAPEPITSQDTSGWIKQAMWRAERVEEALKTRRDALPEADMAMVESLLASMPDLEARLRELLPDPVKGRKIRHHGDFHLGQVLIVKDDVSIIDFEGEPRRSMADRRKKAPAARDVAGLLRSIDYSTTAALERALRSAPDEHGRIARALDIWRDRSAATFVDTYRKSVEGHSLWPANARKADRVLDFFLLEKAFYEIGYELAHRPEWLRVPLTGVLRIFSAKQEVAA